MKKLFVSTIATFLTVSFLFAADQPSFPADITHGNVRCVLMSVGQTTVLPNQQDREGATLRNRDSKQGVPCFTVTFLVEALGDAPSEPHWLKNLTVLSNGKPLHIEGGEYQQWFDYNVFQAFLDFSKPKVTNPKRAVIVRFVRFESVTTQQPLSLIIETGFQKDIQKFQFDSIHLQ